MTHLIKMKLIFSDMGNIKYFTNIFAFPFKTYFFSKFFRAVSVLSDKFTTWSQTKSLEKKAWWKLPYNALSCFETAREALLNQITFVRPFISHLSKNSSKPGMHNSLTWRARTKLLMKFSNELLNLDTLGLAKKGRLPFILFVQTMDAI